MRIRNFLSIFFILSFALPSLAQPDTNRVDPGEVLIIHEPENYGYSHVNFPRANFIIKAGGRPDFKLLKGVKVEVTEVETRKNGESKVILRRVDGEKFFGKFPAISANYEKALKSGELKKVK
ncbi:hypothetical protein NE848_15365 [Gramella jeungdoensis]|uniref:Dihydroorotase n=1 Tax=Gramella jeungdoensis TaxID=708091 RepID=A0ABT0Z5G9_9FLAO|nr:hypothetical protein [Gramella jeungdoensis]MCM8570774.1 hypothetical protein [Gramella jeungdoensis]